MSGGTRILGVVLAGLSGWFLASCVHGVVRQHRRRDAQQLHDHATRAWEGEGGAVIAVEVKPVAV